MQIGFEGPIVLALALCLAPANSASAAGPMDSLFGNTVVVTVPMIGKFKTTYQKDGTYNTLGPMGPLKGSWTLKDGQLCRTQTEPAPSAQMTNPRCEKLEPHTVGDTWQVDAMGRKFNATLVAGPAP
jgi:hypothetical protein